MGGLRGRRGLDRVGGGVGARWEVGPTARGVVKRELAPAWPRQDCDGRDHTETLTLREPGRLQGADPDCRGAGEGAEYAVRGGA